MLYFIQVYPAIEGKRALPEGSFVTCSSDNTIRVWNVTPGMDTDTNYKRNIYSNVSRTVVSCLSFTALVFEIQV